MSVINSLKVKFNNDFKPIENSEFVQGTALIAYVDKNRNGSFISQETFEDAMPSLPLIPIVGNWISEKQNFGGHDVTIEKVGGELILKDNTIPYGVVKENHNAEWVEIEDGDKVNKYLKADVVLWAGRYSEPVGKVIEDGANQSMEINVVDFDVKDDKSFEIKKFEYSALCLLGRDVDSDGNYGKDNVEPCFESASVVVDKFSVTDEFKTRYNELKFALEESNKTTEDVVEDGNVNVQLSENEGENVVVGNEDDVVAVEENVVEENSSTEPEKFELTASETMQMLNKELGGYKENDGVYSDYYVFDYDSKYAYINVYTYDSKEEKSDSYYLRCPYLMEGEKIKGDMSGSERVYATFISKSEKEKLESERNQIITDYEKQIESFKADIDNKDKTIDELTTFKTNVEKEIKASQVEELLGEFEAVLKDSEEFVQLKKTAIDMEIAELEKELYALEGKLKHEKKNKAKEKKFNYSRVIVDVEGSEKDKEDVVAKYYGEASKYFKK